jgi:hypothetical protein
MCFALRKVVFRIADCQNFFALVKTVVLWLCVREKGTKSKSIDGDQHSLNTH